MNNRRNFIKNAAIGTLASMSMPAIVSSAFAAEPASKKVELQANDVVLFQGDSITDWGHDKKKTEANDAAALGSGYVFLATAQLLREYADKNLHMYNRGISGNKVYQLADRWDTDALALKPNVLSILVGVNDYWHTLTNGYKGTIDTYKTDYHKLIDRTKQAFPDVKLIIGEPFGLKAVGKAVSDAWYPTFDLFRQAARDIASEYGAAFIPYQSVFDEAQKKAPANYWSFDGVHPTIAGASLMAHAWMETVKG
jgi:lysophospholipase L1-like esterase